MNFKCYVVIPNLELPYSEKEIQNNWNPGLRFWLVNAKFAKICCIWGGNLNCKHGLACLYKLMF